MTSQKGQKQNISEPDCSGGTLVFTPRGGIVDGHMKVNMNSGNFRKEVLFSKFGFFQYKKINCKRILNKLNISSFPGNHLESASPP